MLPPPPSPPLLWSGCLSGRSIGHESLGPLLMTTSYYGREGRENNVCILNSYEALVFSLRNTDSIWCNLSMIDSSFQALRITLISTDVYAAMSPSPPLPSPLPWYAKCFVTNENSRCIICSCILCRQTAVNLPSAQTLQTAANLPSAHS